MEALPVFDFLTPPITEEQVRAFCSAVRFEQGSGIPPSFPTCFRKAEFQFLDYMKVDMRQLLHLDQEYEYLEDLKVGDAVHVKTERTECKEKRGMLFVTLKTELSVNGKLKITSNTTFVVRKEGV